MKRVGEEEQEGREATGYLGEEAALFGRTQLARTHGKLQGGRHQGRRQGNQGLQSVKSGQQV